MSGYQVNTEIEELIRTKDAAGLAFSDEDRQFIARHEGKGGYGKEGATGEGVLYQFFTPEWLCDLMWKKAWEYGYDGGAVLEPSCATGRFFKGAPEGSSLTGFELDPILARIAQILYPKASIYNQYFETAFLQPTRYTSLLKKEYTWLKHYPFSLVIGNPPYGKYKNKYSSYFSRLGMHQIENFFMLKGLGLLKEGGLLIYVTSSNYIRSGLKEYRTDKMNIAHLGDLIDAYRLPPVFTNSQVPTDVLIMRKNTR